MNTELLRKLLVAGAAVAALSVAACNKPADKADRRRGASRRHRRGRRRHRPDRRRHRRQRRRRRRQGRRRRRRPTPRPPPPPPPAATPRPPAEEVSLASRPRREGPSRGAALFVRRAWRVSLRR